MKLKRGVNMMKRKRVKEMNNKCNKLTYYFSMLIAGVLTGLFIFCIFQIR